MSLVVSDSGPVHYLVLCGEIDILPRLYGRLVIPAAVAQELTQPQTPAEVSRWIQALPAWAAIQIPAEIDPSIHLGLGERQAIALALELKAAHLLVDDRAARRIAIGRGLLIAGTLGVLEQAAMSGLLNLPDALVKLLKTNFRINPDVVREVLDREGARKRDRGGQV